MHHMLSRMQHMCESVCTIFVAFLCMHYYNWSISSSSCYYCNVYAPIWHDPYAVMLMVHIDHVCTRHLSIVFPPCFFMYAPMLMLKWRTCMLHICSIKFSYSYAIYDRTRMQYMIGLVCNIQYMTWLVCNDNRTCMLHIMTLYASMSILEWTVFSAFVDGMYSAYKHSLYIFVHTNLTLTCSMEWCA